MNIQNKSLFKDFMGDYADMENPMDFTWPPTTTPGKYWIVFTCIIQDILIALMQICNVPNTLTDVTFHNKYTLKHKVNKIYSIIMYQIFWFKFIIDEIKKLEKLFSLSRKTKYFEV